MKSILIFARHLDLVEGGGSSRSLHTMSEQLHNNGWKVEVHVTDNLNLNRDYNYSIIDLTSEFSASNYVTFSNDVKKHLLKEARNFDLVHLFNPAYAPIAGYVRNKVNTPMICRLNTYTIFCTNHAMMDGACHQHCSPLDRIKHSQRSKLDKVVRLPRYITQSTLEKKYLNKIDQYFAISPSTKKIHTEHGISTDITVIPNFIDSTYDEKKAHKNIENDGSFTHNLLYVGRLEKQKGVSVLIQAIDQLDNSDVHLNIIGDGDQRQELEKLTEYINHSNKITFHGWVEYEYLPAYYENCDLFIHPHTWPEPFGRVILEALQFNCPIITSDTGAPPWIAGEAGISFKPRDSTSLCEKIQFLLDNEEEMRRMRGKTEERVEKFQPEKIVPKIEQNYENLLEHS